MNISQAIYLLEQIRQKYSGSMELFFDCPHCKTAFTPDKLVTEPSIHIQVKK